MDHLLLLAFGYLSMTVVSSYTEYDNFHYVGVWAGTGDVITWYEALAYCNGSMGTDLASIHSESQNTYAFEAAVGTGANLSTDASIEGQEWAWIGLNDLDVEDTFTWSDGSDNNYTKWRTNQPASGADSQDCVHFWYGDEWNDRSCSGTEPYSTAFVCNRLYVPAPEQCFAYWIKNPGGTDFVRFAWSNASIPDSDDVNNFEYSLGYYVDGNLQSTTLDISLTFKDASDFDKSIGVEAIAGTIQTVNTKYSEDRTSLRVNCTSVTTAPTDSPTVMPSDLPSLEPSNMPTISPTWDTPYLYIGGDICDSVRCGCSSDLDCVGSDIYATWHKSSEQFVTFEQKNIDFGYPTLIYWYVEYIGATNTTANISSSNVDSTIETTVDIDPMNGYLNVSRSIDSTSNNGRELLSASSGLNIDDNDYDIYLFKLILKNCSIFDTDIDSKSYDECDIVYPSELYIVVDTTISETETKNTTEAEISSWLWWLIFGLIVFLVILIWLIYRFWSNNKRKQIALEEKQGDLDQAIEEAENGFGGDLDESHVKFNPLATGMPSGGQAGGNPMNPNQANVNRARFDKADVTIEKFHEKSQFGQVAPRRPNY